MTRPCSTCGSAPCVAACRSAERPLLGLAGPMTASEILASVLWSATMGVDSIVFAYRARQVLCSAAFATPSEFARRPWWTW